jgi:hypothetical protein
MDRWPCEDEAHFIAAASRAYPHNGRSRGRIRLVGMRHDTASERRGAMEPLWHFLGAPVCTKPDLQRPRRATQATRRRRVLSVT